MYHYLTGSASWLMMTMVIECFGVKGDYGKLCLEPKLVADQLDQSGKLGIRLFFHGVEVHVVYQALEQKEVYTKVKELRLDGEVLPGNSVDVQLLDNKKTVEIRVILE